MYGDSFSPRGMRPRIAISSASEVFRERTGERALLSKEGEKMKKTNFSSERDDFELAKGGSAWPRNVPEVFARSPQSSNESEIKSSS